MWYWPLQYLLPLSVPGLVLSREMQVEVAVHLLIGNHSVAESAFVRTAALHHFQLRPNISRTITQLRTPERLENK